jgi:hypothetical protein
VRLRHILRASYGTLSLNLCPRRQQLLGQDRLLQRVQWLVRMSRVALINLPERHGQAERLRLHRLEEGPRHPGRTKDNSSQSEPLVFRLEAN